MTDKIENIICNVLNNMASENKQKHIFATVRCIDSYKELFTEAKGYKVFLFSNVTKNDMNAALDWYAENTDWSCFKRKDWMEAKSFVVNL